MRLTCCDENAETAIVKDRIATAINDNMEQKAIIERLTKIGFNYVSGVKDRLRLAVTDYTIDIDTTGNDHKKWRIDYGASIVRGRDTTSNLSDDENLVVLECVVRLLRIGYPPSAIELEKHWKIGGYLDILVKDSSGKAYIMIECKTWGKAYQKALKTTLENIQDKEQILHYYIQDKNAKYLCLYSSSVQETITFQSNIIDTRNFAGKNNKEEVYKVWDKVYYTKGIFESGPYQVNFNGILYSDLRDIDESYVYLRAGADGEGSIFNRFKEILHRHTISDHSNAYNKIFNLFLCKIVDEDNAVSADYEMEFQWKYDEEAVNVMSRLSDLYKKGMKEYMDWTLPTFQKRSSRTSWTRSCRPRRKAFRS